MSARASSVLFRVRIALTLRRVRWYCKPFWGLVKRDQHEAIVKEICLDIVKKSDEKKRPIGVRYVQMQVLARKSKEVLKNNAV